MKYSTLLGLVVLIVDIGILVTSCKSIRSSSSYPRTKLAIPGVPGSYVNCSGREAVPVKPIRDNEITFAKPPIKLHGIEVSQTEQRWISSKSLMSYRDCAEFYYHEHKFGHTNYGYYGGNVFGNYYYGGGRLKFGLFSGGGYYAFRFANGPGFLGGGDPSIASMEVFHRLQLYQSLLRYKKVKDKPNVDWSWYIYNPTIGSFNDIQCDPGCPEDAFCDSGLCRCKNGSDAMYGGCWTSLKDFLSKSNRPKWEARNLDNFRSTGRRCQHNPSVCQNIDMNLICQDGQCICRPGMDWNNATKECQVVMECSSWITTDNIPKPYSKSLLDSNAYERKWLKLIHTMKDSNLLKHVDPDKTPDYQIERIFCAEVQALSMFYDEQHNSAGLDSWLPWEIVAAIIVPAVFILLLLALGCKCWLAIKEKLEQDRLDQI